ncbi:TRI25 ligase, partial [Atractosteus spatula]|nr:TRI25 ligase [Atractosteus spatula]
MAEGSISVSQDQFSCSVCLYLLKDPVTLLCGHSYCMGCIKNHWDQEDQTGIYSCPQCRQTFTARPDLGRNTILAEVVEKLKETGCSGPSPAHSPAGPGDVLCDVCTGRKRGAVKSCLVCLASYCQTHLQPHYEAVPLKRHKLADATGQLQEKICSTHDKLLEVYCRTDEKCVCYLCAMDEHRGHDTVSAAAGRTEKQLQLPRDKVQVISEVRLEPFKNSVRNSKHSLKTRKCDVMADGVESSTEFSKNEDRKRMRIGYSSFSSLLQNFQSVCVPPGAGDSPSIPVCPHFSPEPVRRAVSALKERLEDICKKESIKISMTG